MDGLAHRTLRQEASSNLPPLEEPTDPSADEPALVATGAPFLGLKLLVDHDATGVLEFVRISIVLKASDRVVF